MPAKAEFCHCMYVEKGAHIVKEGEAQEGLFIVWKGEVSISRSIVQEMEMMKENARKRMRVIKKKMGGYAG